MSVIIKSGSSSTLADVDTNKNLKINPPTNVNQAGYATLLVERDDGTVTGSRNVVIPDATVYERLRTSEDTMLDDENLNYGAQNTGKHWYRNTTMTMAWGGGFLSTNGSSITTLNTGVAWSTYRYFPTLGSAELVAVMEIAFTATTIPTNTTIDFGFFVPNTAATPYAPLDGVFFRANSSGIFGVANYNGTETTTSVFSTFSIVANANNRFKIVLADKQILFMINNTVYGVVGIPAAGPQMMMQGSLPLSIRHAIGGVAASAIIQAKMSNYTVYLSDFSETKAWAQQNAARGQMAYQGQSGMTMGTTAQYANSTTPAAQTPTNTTAVPGTGLGGNFQWNFQAVGATDYIISSYLNPVPSTALTGKTLYITGIKIASAATVALGTPAAGINCIEWSLAFGHTALSLATGEAAAAKAPRRIGLGFQTFAGAAVIGTMATDVYMAFNSPVVVNPGEYVATVAKCLNAAASATGAILSVITIDGYWE